MEKQFEVDASEKRREEEEIKLSDKRERIRSSRKMKKEDSGPKNVEK